MCFNRFASIFSIYYWTQSFVLHFVWKLPGYSCKPNIILVYKPCKPKPSKMAIIWFNHPWNGHYRITHGQIYIYVYTIYIYINICTYYTYCTYIYILYVCIVYICIKPIWYMECSNHIGDLIPRSFFCTAKFSFAQHCPTWGVMSQTIWLSYPQCPPCRIIFVDGTL